MDSARVFLTCPKQAERWYQLGKSSEDKSEQDKAFAQLSEQGREKKKKN